MSTLQSWESTETTLAKATPRAEDWSSILSIASNAAYDCLMGSQL